MSVLTVKNRAQSLFPDGLQDSMILRNDGPFTVYVDNDSTVNATSHAIPPTGTMAWDSTRPLFVSLDPALDDDSASTVTIVRNSQPAVFSNAIDNLLFDSPFLTTPGVTSDPIECAAYESLQIRVQCIARNVADGAAYTESYIAQVTWYDSAGNHMGLERFYLPPYWSTTSVETDAAWSRLNIPVQGSFFSISIGAGGAADSAIVRVVGTTRAMRYGMACGYFDTDIHGTNGVNSPLGVYHGGRSIDVLCSTVATLSFYIPNLGPKLRVMGYPESGTIRIVSAIDTNWRHSVNKTFGVGTNNIEAIMPLYEPSMIYWTPAVAPSYLQLTWYD